MSEQSFFAFVAIIGIIAALLGYLLAYIRTRSQVGKMQDKYIRLNEKFSEEKTLATQKFSTVEKVRDGLEETISHLSDDDVDSSTTSDHQAFIQSLLKPLQAAVHSTDQQAKRISRENDKAFQLIEQQLDLLKAPQKLGRGSTKEIASALTEADARHVWGINTLKQLLEVSYMTDHYRVCEESPQDGKNHPPCQIMLPGDKVIAIDCNTPLEPYINICQAPDPSVRKWHLESHARKLRDRVHEMSGRVYQSRFTDKPTMTMLLALNDHYITTALEVEPTLLEDALKLNIAIATPTDLLNVLQTSSFAWRQQSFSGDANEIREAGVQLYKRFGTFARMLGQVGSELSSVLESYNKAVSYFEQTDKPHTGGKKNTAELKANSARTKKSA